MIFSSKDHERSTRANTISSGEETRLLHNPDSPIKPIDPASKRRPRTTKAMKDRLIRTSVIIVAVAVIGALCGIYAFKNDVVLAHAAVDVSFSIEAENYNPETDTPVALHIEGRDLDGNNVSQDVCATPKDNVHPYLRGSYTVKAIASPILDDGTMFYVPGDEITFTIGSDNKPSQEPMVKFSQKLDPASVTDEEIEASIAMARDCGMSEDRLKELKEAAEKKRSEAIEKKKEEERKAKEAEEARKYRISNDYFSFVIPKAWRGKVEWSTGSDSTGAVITSVYLKGNSQYELIHFRVTNAQASTPDQSNKDNLIKT